MEAEVSAEPLFRTHKRRKIIRRARDSDGESETDKPATANTPLPFTESRTPVQPDDVTETATVETVVEDSQPRRAAKPIIPQRRRHGVEFSARAIPASNEFSASHALVKHEPGSPPQSATEIMANRFAPQMGAAGQGQDKHMTAFVDAEMRRMYSGTSKPDAQLSNKARDTNKPRANEQTTAVPGHREKDATTLGQLQEIDLGPHSAAQNAALTEAARRRLEDGDASSDSRAGFAQKQRLGKDGKPRRRRWRRGSDDLARDSIVDAVLKESTLDIYEPLPSNAFNAGTSASAIEEGEAADARFAEQFQQEYLESLQERRAHQPSSTKQQQSAQQRRGLPGEEKSIARGPKLGGSRSARAAMHAREQAERDKKKAGLTK